MVFRDDLTQPAAAVGMMIGVYTGGTFNMSAIGIALGVEEEVFILLNSADIVFSGIYFIFLLTIGQRVLGRFLPSHKRKWINDHRPKEGVLKTGDPGRKFRNVIEGILLSVLSVALAVGLSYLLTGKLSEPLVVLGITTFGIAASFIARIRTFAPYFLICQLPPACFCAGHGIYGQFLEFLSASSTLFVFCGFVVFGSVLSPFPVGHHIWDRQGYRDHCFNCCHIRTAFIGPVANVLGNRDIIAIGITLGLIGYAIGNYLGLGLAFILN